MFKIKHLTTSLRSAFSKRKSEKNDLKKAEKKEKRKPILTGVWNGLVKVFDSKILPDIQGIIRLDKGEFLSEKKLDKVARTKGGDFLIKTRRA